MNQLLFIIARLSFWLCEPILMTYGILRRLITLDLSFSQYFYKIALSIDQHANVVGMDFLNDTMLKSTDRARWIHKEKRVIFGNEDFTISYVIAANQAIDNLTGFGKFWAWFLDFVDKGHLEKALHNNNHFNGNGKR